MSLGAGFQLAVSTVVVVAGWIVAHWLSSARDAANKRRDLRLSYLLEAYRTIAAATNPNADLQVLARIESAVQDVQLLGNAQQIIELHKMFAQGNYEFHPVLEELRKELRAQLELAPAQLPLKFLRVHLPSKQSAH